MDAVISCTFFVRSALGKGAPSCPRSWFDLPLVAVMPVAWGSVGLSETYSANAVVPKHYNFVVVCVKRDVSSGCG